MGEILSMMSVQYISSARLIDGIANACSLHAKSLCVPHLAARRQNFIASSVMCECRSDVHSRDRVLLRSYYTVNRPFESAIASFLAGFAPVLPTGLKNLQFPPSRTLQNQNVSYNKKCCEHYHLEYDAFSNEMEDTFAFLWDRIRPVFSPSFTIDFKGLAAHPSLVGRGVILIGVIVPSAL